MPARYRAVTALFAEAVKKTLRMADRNPAGLDPVLPCALRLVERGVGSRKELCDRGRGRRSGHAEAGSDRDRSPFDREDDAPCERGPDPFRDLGPAGEIRAREDEDEFLAAPAPGEVDVAQRLLEEYRELPQDGVSRRVPVAVVDVLEPVEVRDHDGQRAAETLHACELGGEDLLALPAVRQPGEAVDERLPLDDAVQAGVVEGDGRMGCEGDRGHTILVLEVVPEEDERAEVGLGSLERYLDSVLAPVWIPGRDQLAARSNENPAGGAGCLHCGLDDQAHQLIRIVRRPERFAEARDDVTQAATLGRELVEPRLKLECHLVEGPTEQGELIAPLHLDALLQIATGDCTRCIDEAANRAHDRAPLDVGDASDK